MKLNKKMAAMLVGLTMGISGTALAAAADGADSFSDVPKDHWSYQVLLLAVFVLALPKTFAKNCSHVLPHNGLKFGTSQDAKL